jgi:hypothetical protein
MKQTNVARVDFSPSASGTIGTPLVYRRHINTIGNIVLTHCDMRERLRIFQVKKSTKE